jgi:hypothetical protein
MTYALSVFTLRGLVSVDFRGEGGRLLAPKSAPQEQSARQAEIASMETKADLVVLPNLGRLAGFNTGARLDGV